MIPAIVSARCGSIAGAVVAAALTTLVSTGAATQPAAPACPARPMPAISSRTPADVCIPDGFTGIALDYFDDYSWRAFVALVWPAAPGHRGVAASARSIPAPGPRVFETYKATWEIFHSDGSAPERRFDKYDAAPFSPCEASAAFGDVIIGSVSGIDDIGQAGIGVLDPPIVAQNGRYVRTLTLFNQIAFDHIVKNRFFLQSELPQVPRPRPERPVIEFPMGSIAVKSAWIDMTDLPAPLVKRFYTRTALVKPFDQKGVQLGCMSCHNRARLTTDFMWSVFDHAYPSRLAPAPR